MKEMRSKRMEGTGTEFTLGDLFEDLAERIATARTKALMGERQEALGLFQGAFLEYTRYREVLTSYPGHLSLEHDFEETRCALCQEKEIPVTTRRLADEYAGVRKSARKNRKAA